MRKILSLLITSLFFLFPIFSNTYFSEKEITEVTYLIAQYLPETSKNMDKIEVLFVESLPNSDAQCRFSSDGKHIYITYTDKLVNRKNDYGYYDTLQLIIHELSHVESCLAYNAEGHGTIFQTVFNALLNKVFDNNLYNLVDEKERIDFITQYYKKNYYTDKYSKKTIYKKIYNFKKED